MADNPQVSDTQRATDPEPERRTIRLRVDQIPPEYLELAQQRMEETGRERIARTGHDW